MLKVSIEFQALPLTYTSNLIKSLAALRYCLCTNWYKVASAGTSVIVSSLCQMKN